MEQGSMNSNGNSNGGVMRFFKRNKIVLSVAAAVLMAGAGYKFVYLKLGEKQEGGSKGTQSLSMDIQPFSQDDPVTSSSELKSPSSTKSVEEPKGSHKGNRK